jgi:dTMP kinase
MKAQLITLEGIEGSGKSSNLGVINNYLEQKNLDFINTREPGASNLGKKLRSLLLDVSSDISPEVEMLLMLADRKDHIETIILPALNKNTWVVSDRYMDSTIAYQGGGRKINMDNILSISNVLKIPQPSLTILFDLPVEIALKRATERSSLDRFEREPVEFHQRIRDAYLELARQEPERIKVIDSSKKPMEVESQLLDVLKENI